MDRSIGCARRLCTQPGNALGRANCPPRRSGCGGWERRRRWNRSSQRFGKTGAVITAVDLLRGMGRLLGWKIVDVPGATGYLDTDYAAKGRYAIDALRDVDLVVVHVEASDEASHEGRADKKVEVLERIDADIVGPVHRFLQSQGDYRLLICPDHPTFLRTKTHSHGPVPFALCGTGADARCGDGLQRDCGGAVVDFSAGLRIDAVLFGVVFSVVNRFVAVDSGSTRQLTLAARQGG